MKEVALAPRLLGGEGGWVGGWVDGKVEENDAVGMSYWTLWEWKKKKRGGGGRERWRFEWREGGWVGGCVSRRDVPEDTKGKADSASSSSEEAIERSYG